eukprot:CAMPEP_0180179896 /NCGR_PEP_ID=MMETSP0986-20121125/39281_1 /TAXON_ID=697907 /ORGANISM="non described non described, Strain CCMP2293" /LENGTH=74 /DNA_ID=CAMNT_0022133037 /DNA_START=119 /DNA_END=341 /DNA_ORIENTATION=-
MGESVLMMGESVLVTGESVLVTVTVQLEVGREDRGIDLVARHGKPLAAPLEDPVVRMLEQYRLPRVYQLLRPLL